MRLVVAFLLLVGVWSRISYKGEQVLNCKSEPNAVSVLEGSLDVWGHLADFTVDIRVKTPKERQLVESLLSDCRVVVEDVEELILQEEAEHIKARALGADWFSTYHTYDELKKWYSDFAAANPRIVSYNSSIGVTAEGRDIFAIKISGTGDISKPVVYFQGQIHAREWVSGSTVNYIVNQLVQDAIAGVQPAADIVQRANLVVVPLVNPDGIAYTWTTDRLWRKNRRVNSGSTCRGVDNNRNYPDHWNGGGSSSDPCSDTYMGPSANSERETQATTSFFKDAQKNAPVLVAFDWHSYSQLVLRPYGWTTANSPNETYLAQLGNAYSTDVKSVHGKTYTSQKSVQLYVTSGSASDWFYGDDANAGNVRGGVKYAAASYTVELRPANSVPGFRLPESEIIPTGQENYYAFTRLIQKVLDAPVILT